MSADFRDQMHLATGTLDTSGFGEGDLRDVALVYRTEPPQARTEARDTVNAEIPVATAVAAWTDQPLFTEDGEPIIEVLPPPGPLQIGDKYFNTATKTVSEWNGTDRVEQPGADDTTPETDPAPASTEEPPATAETEPPQAPPVDQSARAGKESKPPAGAARARRGKAAG